jgi:hypothetical protein
MKFESADQIYQPRGIQKCNKMGGFTDSTKRYGFWKKSWTNWSGVFYAVTDGMLTLGKIYCIFIGILFFLQLLLPLLWGVQ